MSLSGCVRHLFCLASQALAGFSLIVSHPVRLSCFVLYLAFVCSMLRSVARSVRLDKPYGLARYLYLFARIAYGSACYSAPLLALRLLL